MDVGHRQVVLQFWAHLHIT